MTTREPDAGRYPLADKVVSRTGYGAMQLAGDGVFGPPRDRDEAIRVLTAAVDAGVDHIDTAPVLRSSTGHGAGMSDALRQDDAA